MHDLIKLEAIKIQYKQTSQGDVISFRIHPNDRVNELANLPLGTIVAIGVQEIEQV